MKPPPFPRVPKYVLLLLAFIWCGFIVLMVYRAATGDEPVEVLLAILTVVVALVTLAIWVHAEHERSATRFVDLIADARAEVQVETRAYINEVVGRMAADLRGLAQTYSHVPLPRAPVMLGPVHPTGRPTPTRYDARDAVRARADADAVVLEMPRRDAPADTSANEVASYLKGHRDAYHHDEEQFGPGPLKSS